MWGGNVSLHFKSVLGKKKFYSWTRGLATGQRHSVVWLSTLWAKNTSKVKEKIVTGNEPWLRVQLDSATVLPDCILFCINQVDVKVYSIF